MLEFDQEKHNSGKGDNVTALQNQVQEVTGIMKENVEKVLERGEKLDDLVDKTEDLQASVRCFSITSTPLYVGWATGHLT